MILSEMHQGEEAVLLALPPLRLPRLLSSGERIAMVFKGRDLAVVEVGGTGLALSGELADRIIVVRAPT